MSTQVSDKTELQIGDLIYVKSISKRRFEGRIKDRLFNQGDWFYTIDGRNYLHHAMVERLEE